MAVSLGVVHGDKIDGHFFETAMQFGIYSQHLEWQRLTGALLEAADHIQDPAIAQKYRDVCGEQLFYQEFVGVRSGPLLSMGRGQLCQSFSEQTTSPWLFMVDSDTTFDPRTIGEMIRVAEDQQLQVLVGVVWVIWTNPDGTILRRVPNVYKAVQAANGEWLVPIAEEELPPDQLCRIGGGGAAAMLIHRDALLKVREEQCGGRPHWFHHLSTPDGNDQYGEDVSFTLRLRQAGIDVWAHTGARFGHAKTSVQYRN